MKRLTGLAMGTAVLFCSLGAFGQHGGHGGGGRSGAPRGAGGTTDSGLTDFNHALAVQATPDQVSQFQGVAKRTEAARKQAQELLQLAAKADSSPDLSRQTATLKDAVEDAQAGNKDFLARLSKSQKAGLKELTKKLEKADSELAKQQKSLDQQLGAKSDSGAIAGTADRLEKALAEFQTQQMSLGKEMGIQAPAM
jgi:hypothetical protein